MDITIERLHNVVDSQPLSYAMIDAVAQNGGRPVKLVSSEPRGNNGSTYTLVSVWRDASAT